MASKIDLLHLTLCAPGDVQKEIDIARDVIENWNIQHGDPSVISIKGTTATIHAKGVVTITASQSGNGDYKAASSSVVVTVQ